MRHASIFCVAAAALVFVNAVAAQVIPPGGSPFNPPLPPPPPPPKIEVPAIPQLDALPQRNYVPAAPPPSFGERFSKCLDEATAGGLRPGERDAYARSCANR